MCADRILDRLEAQLRQWTDGLWSNEAAPRQQELREQQALLDRFRDSLEPLRQQIADAVEREALLTSWVQTHLHVADAANAYRYALELDQLRQQLKQDRERLHSAEQVYHDCLAVTERSERAPSPFSSLAKRGVAFEEGRG